MQGKSFWTKLGYSSGSLSGIPLTSAQSSRLTLPGLKFPILCPPYQSSSLPLSSWSSCKCSSRARRSSRYSFETGSRFLSKSSILAASLSCNRVAKFVTCDLLTPIACPASRTVCPSMRKAMNAARSCALPTMHISGNCKRALRDSQDFMQGRIARGDEKANTFYVHATYTHSPNSAISAICAAEYFQ
jgi:hypothetical protein